MFFCAAHGTFETLVALGLSAAFGLVGAWLGRSRGNAILAGVFFAFLLGPFGLLICILTPRHRYRITPMPDIDAAFKLARRNRWRAFSQLNYAVTYGHALLWCILDPRPPRGHLPPVPASIANEIRRQKSDVVGRFIPSILWLATTPLGWFVTLPITLPLAKEARSGFPHLRALIVSLDFTHLRQWVQAHPFWR